VVNGGNAQNLPDYATLASKLTIPWIAVTDQDIMVTGVNPKTEKVRKKLGEIKTTRDKQAQWKGNLEHCLNSTDASLPTGRRKISSHLI